MSAKAVYTYDQDTFVYLGARLEPEDYEPVEGETLIAPPQNLTKRKFDNGSQKWNGEKATPSRDDPQQILMQQSQIALQQAQFQATQQRFNSRVALQLATITAQEVQNV